MEPYLPYLRQRIEAARPHWNPATVLYREIKAMGYQGKIGMVRITIRPFKPQKDEPVVRFETPLGKQMQADFTTIRRGRHALK